MADPHYEDDASQIAVLELPGEGVSLERNGCVRAYFSNPSPRWAHLEIGASHFAAYEEGDPEDILVDTTRRVQRAIREKRLGAARGEDEGEGKPRKTFQMDETKETLSTGGRRRTGTRDANADDEPQKYESSRVGTDALAASDAVRRGLRSAGISRPDSGAEYRTRGKKREKNKSVSEPVREVDG
jgi:hypothetical protein